MKTPDIPRMQLSGAKFTYNLAILSARLDSALLLNCHL